MSNMSYCRFRNTVMDLEDCEENLWEGLDDMSEDEARARKQLIKICRQIAEQTDEENEE